MTPIPLDRRTTLQGFAVLMTMTGITLQSPSAQPLATRIRPDVASLAGEEMLAIYAAAVAEMQARPAHEPTSWWFQAAIHFLPTVAGTGDDPAWGTLQLVDLEAIFAPPAGADPATVARFDILRDLALGTLIGAAERTWVTCPHHTLGRTFLPWHRLYLAVFERTVEAVAQQIGALEPDATFALPYWNYLVDPALPAAFREPTSALFNPNRGDPANAGEAIIDAVALEGIGTTFPGGWELAGTLPALLPEGAFSDVLESAPHDTVHGRVSGWMGGVARAARDPIFWLHHAQIDRLWESWRQARPDADPDPTTPAGATWLAAPLRFVAPDDTPDMRTAAEVLDTGALLYEYDELEPLEPLILVMSSVSSSAGGSPIAASAGPVQVGTTTVRVPLAPSLAPASPVAPGRVVLRLDGIKAAHDPQTDFDIFVERRGTEGEPGGQPLGRFNLFGRIHNVFGQEHGPAAAADDGMTVEIDVTQALAEAGLADVSPDDLVVTIRPNGRPSADVTIEQIELIGR